MKKLTGTAKALDIIANVVQILCMVAAIMLAVAVVLLLVFNVEAYEFSSSIELGSYSFKLAHTDVSTVRQQFLWVALPAIILLAATRVALREIRRLLAPMREGRPFDGSVSDSLRRLSWIALIGGGVCSVLQLVGEIVMYRLYDFPALFRNENILGVNVEVGLDTGFVFVFLILLLLSCVFRYGEELQKQSDETL